MGLAAHADLRFCLSRPGSEQLPTGRSAFEKEFGSLPPPIRRAAMERLESAKRLQSEAAVRPDSKNADAREKAFVLPVRAKL